MHFPKFHRYVFPRFLVKDWHIHISPYFFTLRFFANLRHERCHQELTVSEMEKADQNQLARLEQLQCAFAGALKYLEMMDSWGQGGNEEWYIKVGMFRVGCFWDVFRLKAQCAQVEDVQHCVHLCCSSGCPSRVQKNPRQPHWQRGRLRNRKHLCRESGMILQLANFIPGFPTRLGHWSLISLGPPTWSESLCWMLGFTWPCTSA